MEAFFRQGEFDHKVNNPFLNFVSAVLDITIIKPLYEAATGEDIITGEDLTDLEKGLKVVFACLDLITLGQAAGATDIADLGAKKALKVLGKAFAVEFASNATATAVASIGDELGLPVPITLLLSMVSGVTVSRAGTKLTIEGSTIKKELDISQDVIGKVDDTISIIDETGVGKINIEKKC